MGRSKKTVSRFWYSETIDKATAKHKGKWYQTEDGPRRVHSVYYGNGEFRCILLKGDAFGDVIEVTIEELEANYSLFS